MQGCYFLSKRYTTKGGSQQRFAAIVSSAVKVLVVGENPRSFTRGSLTETIRMVLKLTENLQGKAEEETEGESPEGVFQ
ncbi:hypothetical protein [Aquifex sp.]